MEHDDELCPCGCGYTREYVDFRKSEEAELQEIIRRGKLLNEQNKQSGQS